LIDSSSIRGRHNRLPRRSYTFTVVDVQPDNDVILRHITKIVTPDGTQINYDYYIDSAIGNVNQAPRGVIYPPNTPNEPWLAVTHRYDPPPTGLGGPYL
jgi:hypothetical protein